MQEYFKINLVVSKRLHIFDLQKKKRGETAKTAG